MSLLDYVERSKSLLFILPLEITYLPLQYFRLTKQCQFLKALVNE